MSTDLNGGSKYMGAVRMDHPETHGVFWYTPAMGFGGIFLGDLERLVRACYT